MFTPNALRIDLISLWKRSSGTDIEQVVAAEYAKLTSDDCPNGLDMISDIKKDRQTDRGGGGGAEII